MDSDLVLSLSIVNTLLLCMLPIRLVTPINP
uniref:Uncharacterized protein n=1 Tax=Arundo donax TaxID=35708 RepID=A0A0A9AZQ8_ARUDO